MQNTIGDWARKRNHQHKHPDARIESLRAVYEEYSGDDLEQGWRFYLNAHSKAMGCKLGASDEMLLMQAYRGVVALAARTRMGLATALTVATWNIAKGHENERPGV